MNIAIKVNHYGGNTTFVFQINGTKYALNGCELFREEETDKICEKHDVEYEYYESLLDMFQKVRYDVATHDDVCDLLHSLIVHGAGFRVYDVVDILMDNLENGRTYSMCIILNYFAERRKKKWERPH